ncbi:MAG: biofilm-associated protein, partial [Nitrosopumilus sp.]
FMTTMKIPEDQAAKRIDFKVMNKAGEEKKISLRIGEIESRIPVSDNIKLTIQGMPKIVHRGDSLNISGTAQPNSAVTAKITNFEGEIINTTTAKVDSKGNWKPKESVVIPLDAPFGEYSAVLSDGREEIEVEWKIESNKVINIAPSNSRYEAGETMKFEGSAVPEESLEVVLEDPLGKEIFSDIIQVDKTGELEFEYATEQISLEGTYTVIATQEKHKEFIFVGLGQSPTIPVNLEFDKLNYKSGETAVISLIGKASDIVSLLVIDPSDKPTGEATSITLQPDGRGLHSIKLDGYTSGVYTAVISKGNTQSTEIFTVGLQTGSGEIEIKTTKIGYHPKDSILILGDTSANVLLDIIMMDPDGNVVKTKETFSDKNGKISESSFRVPSDAESGMWTINAKSGPNFHKIEIEVLQSLEEGLVIEVTDGEDIPGYGKTLNIHVLGASQTVEIEIIAEDGEIVETLQFPASGEGEINQPWIPRDIEPGTYTIKVSDAFNTAESTFQIQ